MNEELFHNRDDKISIISDPFQLDCVNRVNMTMYRSLGKMKFYARVEFINNNTKGEQRIEGNSFDEIYNKTREFLKTLEN